MASKKKKSEKQKYMEEKRRQQRKERDSLHRKKRKTRKKVITIVVSAAAIVIVAGAIVGTIVTKPLHHWIPIEETSGYSVNAAEVSFYAWQIYNAYVESASESTDTAAAVNLPDTSKPLSEQYYTDNMTWEDYFVDAALSYAENVLAFIQAAETENYTSETDFTASAESMLDSMDLETLPSCVKQEDAIHALEMYLKAEEFHQYKQNTLTVSAEEREAYYESAPKSMQVCSYMEFSFVYDDSDETAVQSAEAEELARELRRCTTQEEFSTWVYDYYMENTTLTEDELQSQVESLYIEGGAYTEGDEVSEWMFSESTTPGDTYLINDEENGVISVYLLLSAPERDESHTVSLRQIVLTTDKYETQQAAHDAAEKILQEWEETEEKTEQAFADLADQYTEDTSVSGGLYQDLEKSRLISVWRDWCNESNRKTGDVALLDSSSGACVVYYVGESELAGWEKTADDAVLAEKYNALQTQYLESADVQYTEWAQRWIAVRNP